MRRIGLQNLEAELNKLAVDPKMIASMEQMYKDIRAGKRGMYNARDYAHNIIIGRLFDQARRKAWAEISSEYKIAKLIREQKLKKQLRKDKKLATANILNIYK